MKTQSQRSTWIKMSLLAAGLVAVQANAAQGPQPSICSRGCWSARAPKCSISQMGSLNRAIIHHTAGASDFNTTGLEDSKVKVRGVQNLHMDSNGWCDIGYHFLVDKYGHIFEGRSGSMSSIPGGAHDGSNVNSFGFTMLGYFHTPYNQTPTSSMRGSIYDVIAWKMPSAWSPYGSGTYNGNTVGYLDGHRKVKSTACPGDIAYNNYITANYSGGEARNEVNARKNGGTQNPPYYFGSSVQGWQPGNSSSALAWQGGSWPGVAYGDQLGNDCYWLSPVTSFVGGSDSSINVQVYPQSGTTANHDMKMYWVTAADPGWSEGKSTPTVNYTRQNGWISLNLQFVSSAWSGHTIKQLRLDFDSVNSGARWIVNHVFPQQTPRHWFSSNTEGWTLGNGLSNLGYNNSGWPGVIYADQTGTDPYLLGPTIQNYLAGANDYVTVRVYTQNSPTTSHNMQVYWTTSTDGAMSESKSSSVNYTASNGGWTTVNIPVGQSGNWGGFITRLRLDFTHNAIGTRWLVDSIAINH